MIASDASEKGQGTGMVRATRSLEEFGSLLEAAPDATVLVDAMGKVVLVNSQTEALFGYTRRELLGEPVELLVPIQSRNLHASHRQQYTSSPRVRPMGIGLELHGLRKDGTELPVEISLSPLETERGTLVMASIRDVSDRRRIEQALREKNVELENALRAKDRFLASISHELRTPLTAIIGFTGTLLMKLPGPLTSEQESQLGTIQSSARHLLSLINDLLDLARIESGKLELSFETVVCRRVIEEVAASLRPLAEAKRLRLEILLPEADYGIRTDRRALTQILINLASNAIKFTDTGAVTLGLGRQDGQRGKPGVLISVSDTGLGIRQQDQPRLFQAFERIGTPDALSREGTGLGLHLSARLANLLGGSIHVESEPGRGSTFTLALPEGDVFAPGEALRT